MNRTSLIALAVLAACATTGFAAEPNNGPKTRAQVIAEFEQARADGSLYVNDGEGNPRVRARTILAERAQRAQREAQALVERGGTAKAGS